MDHQGNTVKTVKTVKTVGTMKGLQTKGKIITAALLALLLTICLCTGCGSRSGDVQSTEQTIETTAVTEITESETAEAETETTGASAEKPSSETDEDQEYSLDRDGTYDSKDDVALYLYLYGELPKNYITKKEARKLGWDGGSVERAAPGCCIGGDRYGNYEKKLPKGSYRECDIGTLGQKSRGPKRIVWSEDGIYYTDNHYKSFEQLYDEDGKI